MDMEDEEMDESTINSDEREIDEVLEPIAKYDAERDFTSLDAWKNCKDVKLFCYDKILPLLPQEEKYNLNIQIRKAAVSSTANITEGYGRFHYKEGIQFYRISRGSLYELKDHLITCCELNYISNDLFEKGIKLIEKAKRTLNGYIKFVTQQSK
jgi:four helix bundle protein